MLNVGKTLRSKIVPSTAVNGTSPSCIDDSVSTRSILTEPAEPSLILKLRNRMLPLPDDSGMVEYWDTCKNPTPALTTGAPQDAVNTPELAAFDSGSTWLGSNLNTRSNASIEDVDSVLIETARLTSWPTWEFVTEATVRVVIIVANWLGVGF